MDIPFEVEDYRSDYLCTACGGLVYYDVNDPSLEFCINPECPGYASQMLVLEPSSEASPRLHRELKAEEAKLLELIKDCDHEALALHVYNIRKGLIESAISKRVMPSIPMWHSLGDLLILMSRYAPLGSDKSEMTFNSVLAVNHKRTEHLNFIDDIENGRHKIVQFHDGRTSVLTMKYLQPVYDMLRVYGLASSSDPDSSDLFKFKDIDELVVKDVELRPGVDMADFFDALWPYTTTLRYAFSMHYRTSL